MLNENFKGHENPGRIKKNLREASCTKKRYSFLILLCSHPVPEGFPKSIFRRWWQKKCEKLTLLNKVVYLRENYFFLECHEKIGFFNPTNALQNIIRLYSIPILRYRIISSWTSLPHLYTWILRYRIVRTRWTCFPSLCTGFFELTC